jgi:hypothetical protein
MLIMIFLLLIALGSAGYCYQWAKDQEAKSEAIRRYPLVK